MLRSIVEVVVDVDVEVVVDVDVEVMLDDLPERERRRRDEAE